MPANAYIFQEKLINHAASTLMKMKVGSLFQIDLKEFANFYECLAYFSDILSPLHLKILTLKFQNNYCLVYIYHEESLIKLLNSPKINAYLTSLGYDLSDLEIVLNELARRINEEDFPHEVGVFLGYALDDVLTFNITRKAKLVSYWKVYHKVNQKEKLFNRFDKAKATLIKRVSEGDDLVSLVSVLY